MEWWEAIWQRRARAHRAAAARAESLRRDRAELEAELRLGRRRGAGLPALLRPWARLLLVRLALRRAERAHARAQATEEELRRGIEADAASRAHQRRLPYEDVLRDAARRFGLDR
jgi:hypothetical protein